MKVPETAESGGPFEVGGTLTVYEAAMVYAGRHPGGTFLKGASLEECQKYLGRGSPRGELAWNVLCELLRRIDIGLINPSKRAYQSNRVLDPRGTLISILDLLELAKSRGETPEYLKDELAEDAAGQEVKVLVLGETGEQDPDRSGLAGRPSKGKEVIRQELQARHSRRESKPTLREEATALREWYQVARDGRNVPSLKAIENNIREEYRRFRAPK